MREEARPQRSARIPRRDQSPSHFDPCEWQRRARPQILRTLIDQTHDLRWSRRLINLLLDELHISDDFDRLIGPTPRRPAADFPQLLAIAVLLRHSWCPRDLARTARRLGLSSSLPSRATDLTNSNNANPVMVSGSAAHRRLRISKVHEPSGD
jgi:hypothetical protein